MEEENKIEKQEIKQPCLADLPKLQCALTTESIKEWLESIEVPCSEGLSTVSFRIDEENYTLHTDLLPMVSLVKRYNLEPDDTSILERVMSAVDQSGRLAKAVFERDDEGNPESLMFQVTWVEGSIDHFKMVLREYIGILNNAVDSSHYYYQQFSREEKDAKTAELYPKLEKN